MAKDSNNGVVASDNSINKKYQSLLSDYPDTMKSNGEDISNIDHGHVPAKPTNDCPCPMHSSIMNYTKLLEAMEDIVNNANTPPASSTETNENFLDEPLDSEPPSLSGNTGTFDEKELMIELNKIFTPVLVMQKFENDISDSANMELAESKIINEKTTIVFDDKTRFAQLVAVCAKLIAKAKNTSNWQMFKKAAELKKQSSLNIQQEEHNDAMSLAQKYLVMVSTTSTSSVARETAMKLLGETQKS